MRFMKAVALAGLVGCGIVAGDMGAFYQRHSERQADIDSKKLTLQYPRMSFLEDYALSWKNDSESKKHRMSVGQLAQRIRLSGNSNHDIDEIKEVVTNAHENSIELVEAGLDRIKTIGNDRAKKTLYDIATNNLEIKDIEPAYGGMRLDARGIRKSAAAKLYEIDRFYGRQEDKLKYLIEMGDGYAIAKFVEANSGEAFIQNYSPHLKTVLYDGLRANVTAFKCHETEQAASTYARAVRTLDESFALNIVNDMRMWRCFRDSTAEKILEGQNR